VNHGKGRVTKLSFAVRHHINPSEFSRAFSRTDKRGIPPTSGSYQRIRSALIEARAELLKAKDSHGNLAHSQLFRVKPAV
jgi:hypothetical protein